MRFIILVPYTWSRLWAHSGCDRSTGDAYSSWAPDPTSSVFKDPCLPNSCFCTVPATLFLTFLSCSIVRVSYRIVRVSYRIVYQVFRFLSCFAFIRSIVYRVLRVSGFPFIVSCIFGNYRDHNLNIRKMYDTFRKLHSFCLRSYF